jgi:hypothetical protein
MTPLDPADGLDEGGGDDEGRHDGASLTDGLQALPALGDDTYLRLQAFNLGLVDRLLTDWERDLLSEYPQGGHANRVGDCRGRGRRGVLEVQLDGAFDGGDIGLDDADLPRGLPAVNDGGRGAPVAGVQGPLDPLAAEGTLDPDAAVAARPAPALAAMGAASGVPTPEGQTAGRHGRIVFRPKCVFHFSSSNDDFDGFKIS